MPFAAKCALHCQPNPTHPPAARPSAYSQFAPRPLNARSSNLTLPGALDLDLNPCGLITHHPPNPHINHPTSRLMLARRTRRGFILVMGVHRRIPAPSRLVRARTCSQTGLSAAAGIGLKELHCSTLPLPTTSPPEHGPTTTNASKAHRHQSHHDCHLQQRPQLVAFSFSFSNTPLCFHHALYHTLTTLSPRPVVHGEDELGLGLTKRLHTQETLRDVRNSSEKSSGSLMGVMSDAWGAGNASTMAGSGEF